METVFSAAGKYGLVCTCKYVTQNNCTYTRENTAVLTRCKFD